MALKKLIAVLGTLAVLYSVNRPHHFTQYTLLTNNAGTPEQNSSVDDCHCFKDAHFPGSALGSLNHLKVTPAGLNMDFEHPSNCSGSQGLHISSSPYAVA